MKNDSKLTIPVNFDKAIESRPAGADEVALIAALLPELVKEMRSQPETDRE